MAGPKKRLVLAAVLFLAWLAWLFYLVWQTHGSVVLSRSQFLAADVYVVAQLNEKPAADIPEEGDLLSRPDEEVVIKEILWGREREDRPDLNRKLTIANLALVRLGWDRPGEYLLPLVQRGGVWQLASIPVTPGYFPLKGRDRLRIYPATEQTRRELQDILDQWKSP